MIYEWYMNMVTAKIFKFLIKVFKVFKHFVHSINLEVITLRDYLIQI